MTQPPLYNVDALLKHSRTAATEVVFIKSNEHLSNEEKRSESFKLLLKHSLPLRDVIDVEQLVNRHVLRQAGIDPASIRIIISDESISIPEWHLLMLDEKIFRSFDAEEVYVTVAHEMTHFKQLLGAELSVKEARLAFRLQPIHSRRKHEQEAIFWEATQGAKFGWDRRRYGSFVEKVYPFEDNLESTLEFEERQWAALPVLSRRPNRPVHVRAYRRPR